MKFTQLKDIDLNLLVVFDAIYQERHLTRAGFRLQRTPSAMSHALNRLRTLLDDPLFIRQGNRMVPTTLAEAMVPNIDIGLDLLAGTLKDHGSFDPASSSAAFNIGIMDYCAFIVLPELIPVIKAQAPRLTLQIKHINYYKRPAAIERGDVDLIIGWRQAYGANVYCQHLFSDRDVCICRHNHPRIGSAPSLEQYAAEAFISLWFPEDDEDPLDQQLQQLGYKRKIALSVEHEVMIPELVSRTDYLANVAGRNARKFNRWVPLIIVPIPLATDEVKIYQYWHERHQNNPGHKWLRQTVKSVCSEF